MTTISMRPLLRRAAATVGALLLAASAAGAQQIQQTTIRGFTDVTYRAGSHGTAPSDFALGQFVLHMMSKLSSDVHFMGETVFEYDQNDFVVDVERVIITYSPRSYFNVSAGKHHTPLGYWNNAYHHGTLLQPTIERPLMDRFEDDGGILPVHTVGVLLSGNDVGPAHLGYSFLVGNGIGSTPISDNNPRKSVTAELRSQVTSYLEVGISGYDDLAPRGTLNLVGDSMPASLSMRTIGGHVALLGSHVELISEYQRIMNHMTGDGTHDSNAMFVYAGRRFGSFVPYARWDWLDFAVADPYYAVPSVQATLVGARYDFSAMGTIKLEGRQSRTTQDRNRQELVAQVAIGF